MININGSVPYIGDHISKYDNEILKIFKKGSPLEK